MRKFAEKKLLVATHNLGKLDEIRAMLAPYGIEVVSNADFGLPEPEETETTFVGNARIKAHAAVKARTETPKRSIFFCMAVNAPMTAKLMTPIYSSMLIIPIWKENSRMTSFYKGGREGHRREPIGNL